MKKKLMTILACFVMILVGGLTLAGCGGPTETEISSNEAQELINSQDLNGGFSGGYSYTMAGMITAQVKFNNGNITEFKYEASQGSDSFKMYIKDGKAYLDLGEENKLWTTVDNVANTEYKEYYENIVGTSSVSFVTNALKTQAVQNCTKFIKKVDGNKTELVCQGESQGQTVEMVLTFVDGKLQSVVGSQAGQEMLKLETIVSISFPDFAGFEEYQAPTSGTEPTTPEENA